jgi:hypothetical protein
MNEEDGENAERKLAGWREEDVVGVVLEDSEAEENIRSARAITCNEQLGLELELGHPSRRPGSSESATDRRRFLPFSIIAFCLHLIVAINTALTTVL